MTSARPARHFRTSSPAETPNAIAIATNGYRCGYSRHSSATTMTLVGWRGFRRQTKIDEAIWLDRLIRDGGPNTKSLPFRSMPPIARIVGWLVISHHRLPVLPSHNDDDEQRRIGAKARNINADSIPPCRTDHAGLERNRCAQRPGHDCRLTWQFPQGLPTRSHAWRKRAQRVARQSLARLASLAAIDLANIYALHIARLCLMLADHHYSSLSDQARGTANLRAIPNFPLFANTDRSGALAQRLDDHLLGVTREVGEISHRSARYDRRAAPYCAA